MNKKELVSRVAETLREQEVRKPISLKKRKFQITDDDGNVANFIVKQQDKTVLYNVQDVENIVDACVHVITEALKKGDNVSVHGFGQLGLHYRAPRRTKNPLDGEWITIDGRYVPKFNFGKDLRMAARLYELSKSDKIECEPPYDDEECRVDEGGDD